MTIPDSNRLDELFMRHAIMEAKRYSGLTGDNPLVGCVITGNNLIAAKGSHRGPGTHHAEIDAIRNLPAYCDGRDKLSLYVNLEPCTVFGKTPPCAEAVVRSGFHKVVIGCLDRNPEVQGSGVRYLRSAGIKVKLGVLEKKCVELNRAFFKFVRTGEPFVTLKIAMSIDGKIALRRGASRNENIITSFASRKYVHQLRLEHDAVLTGIGTVLSDDPHLTIRHVRKPLQKKLYRVILDTALRIPLSASVLKNLLEYPVIVATTRKAPSRKISQLEAMGVEVPVFPSDGHGVFANEVLRWLGKKKIISVLVEGGTGLNTTFLAQKLADRMLVFIAPRLFPGGGTVPVVRNMNGLAFLRMMNLADSVAKKSGCDILVEGTLR